MKKKEQGWQHITMRASAQEVAMIDELRARAQKGNIANVTRTDIIRYAISQLHKQSFDV